jgi:hypothetical protein
MTHRYEEAANWFIRMCTKNNWSHGLYTYIAGICYAELSRRQPSSPEYSEKATSLLNSVSDLLQKRKSFGRRRIPFEQFVENKITSFKARAGTSNHIVDGITGPVTEELVYLLCNGQKRMGETELAKSWESLELWGCVECGEEETIAMEFMRSVIDRNAGRLDVARERIENKVIGDGLSKRVPLGCNDWIAGYTYYEVSPLGLSV